MALLSKNEQGVAAGDGHQEQHAPEPRDQGRAGVPETAILSAGSHTKPSLDYSANHCK